MRAEMELEKRRSKLGEGMPVRGERSDAAEERRPHPLTSPVGSKCCPAGRPPYSLRSFLAIPLVLLPDD